MRTRKVASERQKEKSFIGPLPLAVPTYFFRSAQ
jgi:hypothetical protein